MRLNKILKNKRGLILTEVLLAIVLLALSSVVVGGIINTSIKTSAYSRNFVIAQSLVSEGIEGVLSMRNSNWLKYPGNSECWLLINEIPSGGEGGTDCPASGPPSKMVEEEVEYIPAAFGSDWTVTTYNNNGAAFDLSNPDAAAYYQLGIVYFGPNETLKAYVDSFEEEEWDEASSFYRKVEFDSISMDQTEAVFTVTVAWMEGAKERRVSRTAIMYNFQ